MPSYGLKDSRREMCLTPRREGAKDEVTAAKSLFLTDILCAFAPWRESFLDQPLPPGFDMSHLDLRPRLAGEQAEFEGQNAA